MKTLLLLIGPLFFMGITSSSTKSIHKQENSRAFDFKGTTWLKCDDYRIRTTYPCKSSLSFTIKFKTDQKFSKSMSGWSTTGTYSYDGKTLVLKEEGSKNSDEKLFTENFELVWVNEKLFYGTKTVTEGTHEFTIYTYFKRIK